MEKFGKFQLLEVIGRGGMAEIFLAKPSDAVLSKLVALKRILPEFTEDPNFREMFQREGAIALSLRHPGIIAVNEMGMVDQHYYISMEYFPGKTLANVLNKLRGSKDLIDPTDVAFVITRIAEALHYIHNFGEYGVPSEIIHRDVSPHNIMVGFDGGVKLIDFGVAKDVTIEPTQSRALKGKIAYMSPEQVRGETLTKQTDIFSLGIVFWELLMQKKLFVGDSIKDLTAKVMKCDIPPLAENLPHLSPILQGICNRALAKHPMLRYQTAGEMAHDLQEYLRLTGTDSSQLRLGNVIRALFPDDVTHLRSLLRKYEGGPAPASPQPTEHSLSVTSPGLSLPPLQLPQFETLSRSKSQSSGSLSLNQFYLPKKSKSFLVPIALGAVLGIGGVYAFIKSAADPKVASVEVPQPKTQGEGAVSPPPPANNEVAPVVAKTQSLPPVQNRQVPGSQPIARQPTQQSAKQIPAEVSQKPAGSAKVTPPIAKSPPNLRRQAAPPARVKKPIAEVKPKIAPKKGPRKPAALPPAPQEFAYITIIADPETKISVNDTMVGQEITGEIKVPAGKNVVVKTFSKVTGRTQTRSFNFKAMSRNVIEMFDSGE